MISREKMIELACEIAEKGKAKSLAYREGMSFGVYMTIEGRQRAGMGLGYAQAVADTLEIIKEFMLMEDKNNAIK